MATTPLPTNPDVCISYVRESLTQFPELSKVIDEPTLKKWRKNLQTVRNPEAYLYGDQEHAPNFNLLNMTILNGFSIKEKVSIEAMTDVQNRLDLLEKFLRAFPELTASSSKAKSFKNKLKNLDTFALLSTLSELTLAYQLKQSGFSVTFEMKFRHSTTGHEHDVDLTATDATGAEVHLEVHMPNKQLDDGPTDLEEGAEQFVVKVDNKLFKKFGEGNIGDLSGRIFLAVNQAFHDPLFMHETIKPVTSTSAKIQTKIPPGIDGVIRFRDDFNSDQSFLIKELVMKPS